MHWVRCFCVRSPPRTCNFNPSFNGQLTDIVLCTFFLSWGFSVLELLPCHRDGDSMGWTTWAPSHHGWSSCCYYWISGQKQRLRPHILKRQINHLWQVVYIGPFYSRRRSVCPFWNWHTYSGYGFVFITWSAAASTTFWRLGNCRFADIGSHMSQTREPFYGKKVVRMSSWLGDRLILPYTDWYHLEAASQSNGMAITGPFKAPA